MRRITSLLSLFGALIVLGATAGPAAAFTAYSGTPQWSGVVNEASRGVTSASGIFTVPKVSSRCGVASDVAEWVGIGGYGSTPFAQNGMAITSNGSLGVWYEVFSRNADHEVNVAFPGVIRPGDKMKFTLAFSKHHYALKFTWTNTTRHRSLSKTITHAQGYWSGRSADWIVERASIFQGVDNLAAFSPITVSSMKYGTYHGALTKTAGRGSATSVSMQSLTNGSNLDSISHLSSTSMRVKWGGCR